MNERQTRLLVAYLLWLLTGVLGGHQYYMGNITRGVIYTATGAFAGVAWVWDAFTLPSQLDEARGESRGRG